MGRNWTLLLWLIPVAAAGQVREDYYGGWIARVGDVTHVLQVVLRDDDVSGFTCHDCESPDNLAFIDDGRFDAQGLAFTLYHYPANEAPYRERVTAVRSAENLQVTRRRESASAAPEVMLYHRQVPDPALDSLPVNPGPPGDRERLLPGDPESVTPEKILGMWLWGAGPGKQVFMFRRHKDGIRGMVCGPCDRLDAMAPLEKIRWEGTRLHFEIVHENSGPGIDEYGPHSNVADAVISKHEMHLSVVPSYEGPDFTPIAMTLLGPVRDY